MTRTKFVPAPLASHLLAAALGVATLLGAAALGVATLLVAAGLGVSTAVEAADAPPMAPAAEDAFAAGERCVDEAMRWISKGSQPVSSLQTLVADLDYAYDDGSTRDERRMALWYRSPDAFRANFQYGGRDSSFLLVHDQGRMIRDRIRVTNLNDSPTMKELMPMLRNYRAVLQEVGRLLAPKSPGARFRLEGVVANPQATGGQWFKVVRTAPREPMMTYFFGAQARRDGPGLRAIAPDRLIIHGEPGTNYQGDEYRLEGWARDGADASREPIRYPNSIRLYAIGIDPENKPTMRASIYSLSLNTPIDPEMLTLPDMPDYRGPGSRR